MEQEKNCFFSRLPVENRKDFWLLHFGDLVYLAGAPLGAKAGKILLSKNKPANGRDFL